MAFTTTSAFYRVLADIRALIEHIYRVDIKEIANIVSCIL